MNPFQSCSKETAEVILKLIGPMGGGGSLFVPQYAGPFQPDSQFYHLHLFNGWTANCGLIQCNLLKYGADQCKEFAKAEMKAEGRWVIG